jgi:putative colanic acid biosynthesis acetyltransferase WcaF
VESPVIDVAANREAVKYSAAQNAARVAWAISSPLFRFSPRPFFAWRASLLRLFGARVGRNVHVYPSARVTMPWNLEVGEWSSIGEDVLLYDLGRVSIGSRVTISHRAQLCAGTHDYRRVEMPLLKPPIRVGDDAWICANAFVGPGVTVGEGAVVGACAVAVRDVPAWSIVAGNPAQVIGRRDHDRPSDEPRP